MNYLTAFLIFLCFRTYAQNLDSINGGPVNVYKGIFAIDTLNCKYNSTIFVHRNQFFRISQFKFNLCQIVTGKDIYIDLLVNSKDCAKENSTGLRLMVGVDFLIDSLTIKFDEKNAKLIHWSSTSNFFNVNDFSGEIVKRGSHFLIKINEYYGPEFICFYVARKFECQIDEINK